MEKIYENSDIRVYWYPAQCSHSGKCINQLAAVFNMSRKPWVDLTAASPLEIIELIDRCPSGALMYSLPEGSTVDPVRARGRGSMEHIKDNPPSVKIRTIKNGPLLVEGSVTIHGADGGLLKEGGQFALCRCGLSKNRPFCDGNHARQGWKEE